MATSLLRRRSMKGLRMACSLLTTLLRCSAATISCEGGRRGGGYWVYSSMWGGGRRGGSLPITLSPNTVNCLANNPVLVQLDPFPSHFSTLYRPPLNTPGLRPPAPPPS